MGIDRVTSTMPRPTLLTCVDYAREYANHVKTLKTTPLGYRNRAGCYSDCWICSYPHRFLEGDGHLITHLGYQDDMKKSFPPGLLKRAYAEFSGSTRRTRTLVLLYLSARLPAMQAEYDNRVKFYAQGMDEL